MLTLIFLLLVSLNTLFLHLSNDRSVMNEEILSEFFSIDQAAILLKLNNLMLKLSFVNKIIIEIIVAL